jgi:hypothetical protein
VNVSHALVLGEQISVRWTTAKRFHSYIELPILILIRIQRLCHWQNGGSNTRDSRVYKWTATLPSGI